MKLLIWREAEEEAEASEIWYDEQRVGLGDVFLDELWRRCYELRKIQTDFPSWKRRNPGRYGGAASPDFRT